MTSPAAATPLRVVVWSTGVVGRHAIRGVLAHPLLELVGVWVSSQEKVGRDVAELADLQAPTGIVATNDRDALVALRPDCIVHCALTDHRIFEAIEELLVLIEDGINVVSTGPALLQWPEQVLPAEMLDRLAAAGQRTGASLHVNGIDPGWANDVLPLQLTSLSQRIDQVRVVEIADYATYDQAFVMGKVFGFGRPMDRVPPLLRGGVLAAAWGGVVRQLAAGLGVVLDEPLGETFERLPATSDLSTICLDIPAGTQGAMRFEVIGRVDGEDRIVLEHVTRTHPDQAPDWPRPSSGEGCYRVEITGEPVMNLEFTHHGEHGDHNISGMIITAQRLLNAVPAVVAGAGGLLTALDLPLVTGKGLLT